MRIVGSAALCCLLSSCALIPPQRTASPPIAASATIDAAPLTEAEKALPALQENPFGRVVLEDCAHPSGACRQIRETARESYLYAQLATNVYNDASTKFELGPHVSGALLPKVNSKTGFGAQLYYVTTETGAKECVIAYRGTDFFTLQDWIFGNLSNVQYREGLSYYQNIRRLEREKPSGCTQFYVVGHSLGGAIATYVSLQEKDLTAFIFNNSPRLSKDDAIVNKRVAVSQYGEVLALLRKTFINAGGTYTIINCNSGNPFMRHAMRALAECLTEIAASDAKLDHMQLAKKSAETNKLRLDQRILGSSLD